MTTRRDAILVGAGTAALLALLGLFTTVDAPGPLPAPTAAPRGIMGEAPPQPCPGRSPLATGEVVRNANSIRPPQRLVYIRPVYPPNAKAIGVGGTVFLEVIIDQEGIVRTTRLVRSIPLLDEAAVTSVCQSVFTPATIHGEPVAVAVTIPVEF